MKNIIVTNLNTENVTDKKTMFSLTNCRSSHGVRELDGETVMIDKYVLYDETLQNGTQQKVFVFRAGDGNIYGTNSASIIDTLINYFDAGFKPEELTQIQISSMTSSKGRNFLLCDIL